MCTDMDSGGCGPCGTCKRIPWLEPPLPHPGPSLPQTQFQADVVSGAAEPLPPAPPWAKAGARAWRAWRGRGGRSVQGSARARPQERAIPGFRAAAQAE